MKKLDIKELYKLKASDYPLMYETMLDAFAEYPKLADLFPDRKKRATAIEMTIRYYAPYDLKYGAAFSLDEDINELIAAVHSDEMDYSDERCEAAGCMNEEFKRLEALLTPEERTRWWGFFEELDRTEAALDIPRPHIYVDYVCVRSSMQGQGRGSRMLDALCRYSGETGLPVMLFTNGQRDIDFYLKHGFRILAVTESEAFAMRNTYMLYEPGKSEVSDHEE